MLVIPFEIPPGRARGPCVLVIILEGENLNRMKLADPCDLQFRELARFVGRPIADLDLVIAYEEDVSKIKALRDEGNIGRFMDWLERGRRIKPGDCEPLRRL